MLLFKKTILMWLVTVLLLLQGHGENGDDAGRFSKWFGHVSASGPVFHFNDEGSPYRLSLGAGRPVLHEDLTLTACVVYSYYDVNGVADQNPSEDIEDGYSHSLGLDLILRWSLKETPHASYYLEVGGGVQTILTDPPFPADGSNENFTLFWGPGILIPTEKENRLRIALQWFHISNANLASDNSGYDGFQLALGYEWGL